MPIHDLGYRKWNGRLTAATSRWKVIAETGAGLAWKSGWVRRILFFAWLPLLVFAALFAVYEFAANGNELLQRGVITLSQLNPEVNERLNLAAAQDTTQALNDKRHAAWSFVLYIYFRYPQGLAMVLLVGLIAPRLISQDVQTRGFLFYFSRPLSRLEYLLGKSVTVWVFIAGITTLPALMMYFVGIAVSPTVDVVLDTWDIPLRILVASVTVFVPATAIALCFSSLTKESRYAGFAWFALWVLGAVSVGFLAGHRGISTGEHYFEEYLSIYHTFGAVQRWIFGLETLAEVKYFVLTLTIVTGICLMVLFRRISAPMRA